FNQFLFDRMIEIVSLYLISCIDKLCEKAKYWQMAILSKYSDEQLFARLKTGDHAAFTEIYERYWGVLFIQAFKIIKNEEKAMDVVQDIFTVLWENAGDSDIQLSLKAYLYTSVRNRMLDAFRHQAVADKYLD